MARKRYVKAKNKVNLQLTSILDLMTIILVFLLKMFSAEGQILTQGENLILPQSTSKASPKEAMLSIEVNREWVLVDHIPMVKVAKVRENQDVYIPEIKEKLAFAREQEENMVKIGALQRVRGEAVMQVDKNVEYDVLFKVMATCGEEGFNNIRFAVMGALEEM
ncbi:MAG: biopolymer transporter ExbD [Fibrobacterota bacterium]